MCASGEDGLLTKEIQNLASAGETGRAGTLDDIGLGGSAQRGENLLTWGYHS